MNTDSKTPQTVVTATRLLWLVVIIGLISYGWEYMKPDYGMMHNPTTLAINIVFLVCFVEFVNYYLLKAKNWARWLTLVVTLFSLLAFFDPEVQSSYLLFGIITTALEFAAIYLVFSGSSKVWFK